MQLLAPDKRIVPAESRIRILWQKKIVLVIFLAEEVKQQTIAAADFGDQLLMLGWAIVVVAVVVQVAACKCCRLWMEEKGYYDDSRSIRRRRKNLVVEIATHGAVSSGSQCQPGPQVAQHEGSRMVSLASCTRQKRQEFQVEN